MGDDTAKTPISREDYDAIEAAVMETARGRWFMAEFARRNRHADTERLLASLDRIERAVAIRDTGIRPEAPSGIGLQRDLADMADRIASTKRDIAKSVADAAGSLGSATPESALEDLVALSEQADTEAFDAAEQIQEIAWSLRETAENPEVIGALEDLDRHALDVYRATNRHALTTARVRSLIGVLRSIESRIQSMLGGSLAEAPPRPARAGPVQHALLPASGPSRLSPAPPIRDDVAFIETYTPTDHRGPSLEGAVARPAPEPAPVVQDARVAAFAAVDALAPEQKLALFA
jgi:hypothetical protein